MHFNEEDILHYGTPRRSGRYPWGSGGDPANTRNRTFLEEVEYMKSLGLSEKDIVKSMKNHDGSQMTTTDFRRLKTIEVARERQHLINQINNLADKGWSNSAIGRELGKGESTIRSLRNPTVQERLDKQNSTRDMLKREVDEKRFIQIGSGVEAQINVTRTRLDAAIYDLTTQGYEKMKLKVRQVGTGEMTDVLVLGAPGTKQREIFDDPTKIRMIQEKSIDNGRTFYGMQPPLSLNSKRLQVVYKEDGGDKADGVMYVRNGVEDLSLGGKRYAQVRVMVDGTHYLKGMAILKDDMPDGVDIQFNTVKSRSEAPTKLDALKKIKDDADNPFGAVVDQVIANKGEKNERVTSVMNLVNVEGDWASWSRNLSSQMLSKQSPVLAKTQLNMTYDKRKTEYDRIMALSNPEVKKKLLKEFAEATDAAAVHLKAAHLPRQGVHVILPVPNLKPSEIYAPNFVPGEKVVLIRHPHGGPFEIPELTVNNRHPASRKLLGDTKDAVGIHPSVAERLSGADFDGDTVLVIPNNSGKVRHQRALEGLKDFDPREQYKGVEGVTKVMKNTQTEMGKISNLITDMSLRRASPDELARAVRHSMVVIDAEKHGLDYTRSAAENNIKALKQKYQTSGASTLISRAKSEQFVDKRKPRPAALGGPVDRETGELRYVPTGQVNYRTGKPLREKSTKLREATDAHTLSSGTPMERLYADHSNRLKSLANQARLSDLNTPTSKANSSAKKTYAAEVERLNAALLTAKRARPLERHAQIQAGSIIRQRRRDNPGMDDEEIKRISYQVLEEQRHRTGSHKLRIEISPREWEAIQAGAIASTTLTEILNNANMDTVRELATPHTAVAMNSSAVTRARRMFAQGYDRAEVAAQLGVSVSTLDAAVQVSDA